MTKPESKPTAPEEETQPERKESDTFNRMREYSVGVAFWPDELPEDKKPEPARKERSTVESVRTPEDAKRRR